MQLVAVFSEKLDHYLLYLHIIFEFNSDNEKDLLDSADGCPDAGDESAALECFFHEIVVDLVACL